jgi:hypothetical protein
MAAKLKEHGVDTVYQFQGMIDHQVVKGFGNQYQLPRLCKALQDTRGPIVAVEHTQLAVYTIDGYDDTGGQLHIVDLAPIA